jgi:hypothetical protein
MDTQRFVFLTAEQIVSQPPPTWLIEGLIAEDSLAVLYGPPGSGKSFVAQEWALSVAAGRESLSHAVRQGDVAYVYAEGGGGMPVRLRAWREDRGPLPLRFFGLPTPVDMTDPEEVDTLVEDMTGAEIKPALIVIDTLARCFGGGNENVQQDMNAFVRGCDALRRAFPGVTVLVVHHTGWDTSRERGSNVLRAASDTMIKLATQGDAILLRVERQKDAPVQEKTTVLQLTYVPVRDSAGSCVVTLGDREVANKATAAEGKRRRPASSDVKALEALKAAGPGGLGSSEWLRRGGLPSSTFKDARRRLEKSGLVSLSGDRWVIAAGEPSESEDERLPEAA